MIKMITERSTYVSRTPDNKEHYVAQLICDTCAELVGVTGQGSKVYDFGSLALAMKDGEVCSLASDSKWYKVSDGTEVTGV